MAGTYDIGDRIRLGNHSALGVSAFKNSAGADADPSAITLIVKEADGTSTTYTFSGSPALLKETTGRYYVDIDLDSTAPPGTWYYRLAGTGTVMAAEEGSFTVRASNVL
jgi:hypothetical protein